MPGLVIFDNDGVLVDSELLANAVLAELLGEAGHPITIAACMERFMGGTLARVRSTMSTGGIELRDDFDDEYHLRLFGRFDDELVAVPGVAEALERLTSPTCVASSGDHVRIERTLRQVGLLEHFQGRVFSAQDVQRGKPAPDLFLHAATSCGVAPADCVVIEDSPAGVEAGKAAGMVVLGFAHRTPSHRLGAADAVFADMVDLPDLVARYSSPSTPARDCADEVEA